MILRLVDWWLARRGERRVEASSALDVVPYSVLQVMPWAYALTTKFDVAPQGGEWKRHQVYARLLKRFPEVSKRDVALALERAVRELP